MRGALAVVLLVLGVSLFTLASAPTPAVAEEAVVFEWDGTGWVVTDLARAWREGGASWRCNDDRCVEIEDNLSLAQWAEVFTNATRTRWQVLKPGDYAMDSIQFSLKSNGDVGILFSGFGDKIGEDGDIIEVSYAALPDVGFPTDNDWIRAPELNRLQVFIPEDQEHNYITYKIWERVHIEECDSACEYRSSGLICFNLLEQKEWYPWDLD